MQQTDSSSSLVPFVGWRFNPARTGTLVATIGPPADFADSDAAREFVAHRPYSAVRLETESDRCGDSSARDTLRRWQRDGIVVRDPSPAYYIYEQAFVERGERRVRRGIFGLAPLNVPDVCILPHEETWEENRQRRLDILRSLGASVSPIFLIYDGDPTSLDRLVARITTAQPDAHGCDSDGNCHRLWVIDEPEDVAATQRLMQGRHFIIADGHHRFEAARQFHSERGDAATGFVLACCVEAHDPGIVIRPIHRLLHNVRPSIIEAALSTLSEWFEVESSAVDDRTGSELLQTLPGDDPPVAGLIVDGGSTFVSLRLRDSEAVLNLLQDGPDDSARDLDVSVITELVISRAMGIDVSDPEALTYTDDADAVLAAVRTAATSVGLLMRPIKLEQVLDVARAGGRVPAKSTSFVPKVPVGLVLQEFEERTD